MRPIPEGYEGVLGVLVTDEMTVEFSELGRVHPVYATYWLARHMEEAGRKIILPFLEEGEEGIGTAVSVRHLASALPGMRVEVVARHMRTERDERGRYRIFADCEARSELGDLIGTGSTEQLVMEKAAVERGFSRLERRWREFTEARATGRPPPGL